MIDLEKFEDEWPRDWGDACDMGMEEYQTNDNYQIAREDAWRELNGGKKVDLPEDQVDLPQDNHPKRIRKNAPWVWPETFPEKKLPLKTRIKNYFGYLIFRQAYRSEDISSSDQHEEGSPTPPKDA